MKRLVLIRHGKSSWEEGVRDFERDLKDRAYKDAEKVLKVFQPFYKQNISESKVRLWTSPAKRALKTAFFFNKTLQIPMERFMVRPELYSSGESGILKALFWVPDDTETMIVFTHNPGITDFINNWSNKKFKNIPTSGLCVIDFDYPNWKLVVDGEVLLTLFPKNLP